MKTTHHTAWAYAKGTAVTLAMVIGTAALMAAFATVNMQPTELSQDLPEPLLQAMTKTPSA